MRQVSDALAAAITASERTVRTRLSVDWDGDGHGPADSLDDLSGKAAQVTVSSVLQGTQPDQAAVVEGTAAATLTANLAAGDTADERAQAVRYFSPMAGDSPLSGKVRLGRDVQCDVEFLTDSGWEAAPLLRGVSRGLPVRVSSRQAALQAIDYRDRLRTPVALPCTAANVPNGVGQFPAAPGLEATWVASYALWQAGFPVSPTPTAYCRYWGPMHGSATAFLSVPYQGAPQSQVHLSTGAFDTPVQFTDGPFARAVAPTVYGDGQYRITAIIDNPTSTGAAMFDTLGRSAGRVEMWVTAKDTPNTGNAPSIWMNTAASTGGYSSVVTTFSQFGLTLGLTNDASSRNPNGPGWPSDDQWHHVGMQWDDFAGWVDFYVDGTVTTVNFTRTTSNATPVQDVWQVDMTSTQPFAEVHVQTGIPRTYPWLPDDYTPAAMLDRLQNQLDGIVPGDPQEAWQILQDLAAAEQGACYLDADGVPHIHSRAKLITAAAQTPQRTIEATADLFDLAYDYRLDSVFNIITANYQPVRISSQVRAWDLSETVLINPGRTVTIPISYSGLVSTIRLLLGTANTKVDGTGTQYVIGSSQTALSAGIAYVSDTAAVITLTNTTAGNLWMVDNTGSPNLYLQADTITSGVGALPAVVTSQASIDKYGPQPLTMPANQWVQARGFAWGQAMAIVGDLAEPQPAFTDLPIPGDPRLEFFDRLTVSDPGNTGAQLDVWYVGGTHTVAATGQYVQQLAARPARNRFLAGIGLAGVDLVG